MSSVDGLISGLKTTDMIAQLMQVEALPQTALKNKVTVQNKAVSAYQGINTKMAALLTAAKALSGTDGWGTMKASSSSDTVAVTASTGASAGSLSFTVDSLATRHTVTFKNSSVGALTDAVMTGDSFDVVDSNGDPITVTPVDKSLKAVVNAINGTAGSAYTAAAVQLGPGQYTLQLTAKATGLDATFAGAPAGIDGLGAAVVTTQGTDAQLTVGTTATYTVKSASNTFTDILTGVTLTVSKQQTDTPVTISLSSDKEAVAAKVQALVDAANAALTEISTQTRTGTGGTGAGPLVGEPAMRKLTQDILGAVSGGAGGLGSLSAVGITLNRDGKINFNKQTFLDKLTADPDGTRAYFDSYTNVAHANAKPNAFDPGWDTAVGVARKLETIGLIATEGTVLPTDPPGKAKQGVLTGLINRHNDLIGDLNDQVEAWDRRLELRRTTLERQWSALEVALGKLQSQSSWLAGQIAGLPSYSS